MSKSPEKPTEPAEPIKCGIVMPLSECDGCPPSHWAEVQNIIRESLEGTPFKAEMVSEDSVSNILQARIVGNLFKNEMVICDVSGRNPNVMLELGIRLAFDKPVIVIKDDATPYSFDTSPIEHLSYPRSLRFGEIVKFKDKLKEKVLETYEASRKAGYRSFLSHFAQYTPKAGTLPESEVPALQIVQKEIAALRTEFLQGIQRRHEKPSVWGRGGKTIQFSVTSRDQLEPLVQCVEVAGGTVGYTRVLQNQIEGVIYGMPVDYIDELASDFPSITFRKAHIPN